MFQTIRTAATLLGVLTIVTGLIYPVLVTGVAQLAFPREANGSLIAHPQNKNASIRKGTDQPTSSHQDTRPTWVGSELVGQHFVSEKYLWGRPSATAPVEYNGMAGSGSNLAMSNPTHFASVSARVAKLRAANPDNQSLIPIDLVTASASGLDPHISEAAARYQVARIAKARHCEPSVVTQILLKHIERPTIGVFGQSRVNVLKVNLALDSMSGDRSDEEGNSAEEPEQR
ncbi:potassium-transporting ATPase subunit KdpC [Schlesneria sp. DSM 10557]|uniref:potassium-transporting ATPase subunit KdpC n=1 Tax=Schlesneria sp. DSM 10557 TaxID=3044399 RepID=UPI00359F672F